MKKINAYSMWENIEDYVSSHDAPAYYKSVYRNKYLDVFFQASDTNEIKIYIHFNEDKGNKINIDLNGIRVVTRIKQDLDKKKDTIEIINKSIENNNLFKAFSATLFDNLKQSYNHEIAFQMVNKTIMDYKDYFDGKFKKDLSKTVQQGIFGELAYILSKVEEDNYAVINHWEGVDKNKHDFVYDDYSKEIKTTRNQQRLDIRISNENQLDNKLVNKLLLRVYRLEEVNTGESVTDLYKMISSKIPVQHQNVLTSKMLQLGVDLTYNDYFKFKIISKHEYLVDDQFPKIIKSSLDERLFDIKYKLNLDGIEEL